MTSFIRSMVCARCKHGFPPELMKTISKGVHVCKDTNSCVQRQRDRVITE